MTGVVRIMAYGLVVYAVVAGGMDVLNAPCMMLGIEWTLGMFATK